MRGLKKEWDLRRELLKKEPYQLVSIYFGGGTPSLLGPEAIGEILKWIQELFPLENTTEVTLEANPENISRDLMQAYFNVGINRVSLGIQTLDNSLLQTLERLHSSKKAIDAVWQTAEAGIHNISIDLMYDLPGQTYNSWKQTLTSIVELPITHLSLYNLTFEPHTVFFKKQSELKPKVPLPEISVKMYLEAISALELRGLNQYEISAFAKENFQSKHNVGYWTARPFLGFGPSAYSFWEGARFKNVSHLNRYCKALEEEKLPVDFEEKLLFDASQRELLAVQLRLLRGVNLKEFTLSKETIEILFRLQKEGYLIQQDEILKLTRQGILFYDSVATEII